jgi:NDP-sugar pyrophosphorylase family protein
MSTLNKKNLTLVYMVAGLSSRFGGKAKAFARVGPSGETLLEYSLNQALKSNFNKIVLIVGDKTEKMFKDFFGNNYKGIPIFYAKQTFDETKRDKPWGTCDAIVSAKKLLTEPFVVCNGDDLYGENTYTILADWVTKNNSPATIGYNLLKVVPEKGSVNRGIFSVDENGNVSRIDETLGIERNTLAKFGLSEKNLSSQNIFCLLPSTVTLLEEQLEKFKENNKQERKKECYLPTELSNLINEKKLTLKLLSTPDEWTGITNPEDEEIVKKELSKTK